MLPFGTLMALLALSPLLGPVASYPLRAICLAMAVWASRRAVRLRPQHWVISVALGVAVFAIWVGPDLLWPGYRAHWLFHNALTGTAGNGAPPGGRVLWSFLFFRVVGSVLLVPIAEELFWRAWLMRWVICPQFEKVPLGAYTARAFWITAVLFASEHGAYWDVGLLAGIAYNLWMVRTRSLADCILAHAVTNGCLAIYVLTMGRWEYWM